MLGGGEILAGDLKLHESWRGRFESVDACGVDMGVVVIWAWLVDGDRHAHLNSTPISTLHPSALSQISF